MARLVTRDVKPLEAFDASAREILALFRITPRADQSTLRVLGSGALKGALYPSDIDAYCIAEARTAADAAVALQHMVRLVLARPLTRLMDFKIGEDEAARVLPPSCRVERMAVVGWDRAAVLARLRDVHARGLISDDESTAALATLNGVKEPLSVRDLLLRVRPALRFEVLRWRATDVLAGEIALRAGRKLTLVDAIQQPALVKVDLAFFEEALGRFWDASCIFELHAGGRTLNDLSATSSVEAIARSVATDLLLYGPLKGKWMKACKRMLSLSRLHGRVADEEACMTVVNSAAGSLYQLLAEFGTLEAYMEHAGRAWPFARAAAELDACKMRVANLWGLRGLSALEPQVLKLLDAAAAVPRDGKGAARLRQILEKLERELAPIVADGAKTQMASLGLLPLNPLYLP